MPLSPSLISEIRKRTATGPFVFLITLFSESKAVLERLTSHSEDIIIGTTRYKSYPLVVRIPEISKDLSSQVEINLANFPNQAGLSRLKDILSQSKRADFKLINKKRPSDELFNKVSYIFSEDDFYRITNSLITISFSIKILEDKSFPYRRINSATHPFAYADFISEEPGAN